MKTTHIFIVMVGLFISLLACRKHNRMPEETKLGNITVALDANVLIVRKKESLIGNLICDAIVTSLKNKGKLIDGAFVNGGNIRFSSEKRPDGIYPAGNFTDQMVTEMMPFGNEIVIAKVSGRQLKEIFERSLFFYPIPKGPFLQVSKGFKITIDTTKAQQLINNEGTAIIAAGKRITSISINNINLDSNAIYTIMVPDFIAEGNDGYVTFKNLAPTFKELISEDMGNALKELLLNDATVTPALQNRIVFE